MICLRNIPFLAAFSIAGTFAQFAAAADTIAVDAATRYQTMTGWEAHARAFEENKAANAYDPAWKANAAAVAGRLVNELGINRIQVPLRSGWLNPVDYWAQFAAGTISYSEWNVHRYEKVSGAIQFSEFDFRIETMVLPMAQALAARGEKLYVNLDVVDFNTAGYLQGTLNLAANPSAYADFVLACFNRLKTKYGITADALELNNEPENTPWTGAQMGAALVAAKAQLVAAGYSSINYIGPSSSSAGQMQSYADAMLAVPGAAAALTTLSYHRYDGPGASTIAALNNYAKSKGLKLDMSEWINATADTLIQDLTVGNVSSWQKWALANLPGRSNPQAFYYLVDLTNPAGPAFSMAPNTAFLAQYFRYVRLGAVRVAAQSSVAAWSPVAFVNADGNYVVVVKTNAGTGSKPVTLTGLQPGTYGVRTTNFSEQAVDLPDMVAAADGSLTMTIPDGFTTIYGKGSSSATTPGTASIIANPYGALGVQGGTLAGNTISNLQSNVVIQLGDVAGAAGSQLRIDFQGFNIGAGNTVTIRSGAAGQRIYLFNADASASALAGVLEMQGGNGAPAASLYLHNPNGIAINPGGSIIAPSGLTLDALGSAFTTGQSITNSGEIDGGGGLELLAAQIHGGGAFVGDAITMRTFGNANNPANGTHFLSNGLQLFPSSGNSIGLTLNAYGSVPQVLNLQVYGDTTVWMPSAWPTGSLMPANNAGVLPGGTRPAGVPDPSHGGGSMIVQASGTITVYDGGTNDFVFPGGIVLKAGGDLNLNGVGVNQGWTTSGMPFQGVFFESPNIVSVPGTIQVFSNDLNWINFSTFPHAPVRTFALIQANDGSSSYVASDLTAPHVNTYSALVEAAANGQCYICIMNTEPVNMLGSP